MLSLCGFAGLCYHPLENLMDCLFKSIFQKIGFWRRGKRVRSTAKHVLRIIAVIPAMVRKFREKFSHLSVLYRGMP